MLAFIPEITIKETIQKLLNYVKYEYKNNSDKTKTILYRLLYNQVNQKYNYFEESKEVFLKNNADPRVIQVNTMFNRDRQSTPTIHIMLPSESEVDGSLGIGEGELDYFYNDTITNDFADNVQRTFQKRFRANYNIVITSDNVNETLLIYHVLRSLLISANEHFNLSGLFNIKLGGRDLQINSDLVPTHLFMKSISLDCEYEIGAIELLPISYATDFTIEGTAVLDDEDQSVSS